MPRQVPIDPEKMREHADEASTLVKALANKQRLMILCLLVDRERAVGELNGLLDLSQSALSQHLAVLREENLVNTRRDGQTIHYSLMDGPALRILQVLHDTYCAPHPA
jgi:DNA-binding transcriptional ArsR family regulator